VRAGVETFVEGKRPGTNRTVYRSVYVEGAPAPPGTDIWRWTMAAFQWRRCMSANMTRSWQLG